MTSNGSPLVSLLVAAYNEERHIGACLRALLAQTWPNVEILVVDDGSTDGTRELAGRFPSVSVLRQEHVGKARAMNWAAREAHGEFIFFMDADIEYAPDYVARMVKPIIAGECLGTCHGTEFVANPENPWAVCWQLRAGLPPDVRLRVTPAQLAQGSRVYRALRRADFLRVGGFDDTGFLDDQTLFPKLGQQPAQWVPEAVCRHYNADRLAEVYLAGRWNAKSLAHLYGRRVVLRYLPPFALGRAISAAWRHRRWAMLPYVLVTELGTWFGAWQFCFSRSRHFGK